MQRTKSNSKQKVLRNTNKLINQYRQNSVDNKAIQKSSNKRINMNSPLLQAQRNLKLVMKNQLKKQLFQAQFPLKSLPKLFKSINKNYSTLNRDCVSTIEKSSQLTDYLPNNKQIKALKNLLINVKQSNKSGRDRSINLLGLQIKKIESQINPEETSLQITNMTNFINHHHFSSISYFKQKQFEQNLILKHEQSKQKQQSNNNVKQIILSKKKTFSLPSVSKNHYFHYKAPKFNFNLGSESYKIYERRMKLYQQFIFTIQFAHNVYIKNQTQQQQDSNGLYMRNQNKYKIWIGSGNNWMLIKSLIKRRYWWLITQDRNLSEVNFVWTQLKVNSIFQKQKPSQLQQKAKELRKYEQDQESQQQKTKITHQSIMKRDRRQTDNLNVQFLHKILNPQDKRIIKKYVEKKLTKEKKVIKPMQYRHKNIKKQVVQIQSSKMFLVHNHLENNFFLGNKKAMFYNLKQYYELIHDNVFNYLPLTFHIKNGTNDIQYKRFQMYYNKRAAYIAKQEKEQKSRLKKRKYEDDQSEEDEQPKKKYQKLRNIWIVKPGQLSNRGNGITVIDQLKQINNMLNKKQKHQNGTNKTFIVQLYIDRPMLYNNRKFDIRHYMLITNMFGVMRGYWYQQGYIRTASYQFDIFTFDKQIHLTNDAVQKYSDNYGKYEPGNKLSYSDFQKYLDSSYPEKGYSFQSHIIPKMKKLATDAVKSAFLKLSPTHKQNNFEIFGLDFMIDRDFKPWLIEINTNPCLQLSCPLLQRIIPVMVQSSFRLSLDIMFPPPGHYPNTTKHLVPDLTLQNQKYQLIFDSLTQGASIQRLYKDVKIQKLMDEIGAVSDEQQQFQDEGQQLKFDEL